MIFMLSIGCKYYINIMIDPKQCWIQLSGYPVKIYCGYQEHSGIG